MALTGSRTFVGFGFGPIQAGLFLHEADRSGVFGRLVVAEVVPEVVAAVRAGLGRCAVNVAYRERVERVELGPVEILDPASPADRRALVEAIAEAEEVATAVPSVEAYARGIADVLADGLRAKARRGGRPAVVYTAENHNHAAALLERAVGQGAPSAAFLDTVIGKMSRVVAGDEVRRHELAPVVPGFERAFLVEAFNRILISRVPHGFTRGIGVFEEKDDLLPFEEAKLYGHNATHALGGFLARLEGVELMADVDSVPGLPELMRAAFVEESGAALCRRHAGVDPLFTPAGWAAYADDLLARMTNPLLLDTIARVTRDPDRKLGWNDRLVGTMRVALAAGIEPRRFALGAAAALAALGGGTESMARLWRPADPDPEERAAVLGLVTEARRALAPAAAESPHADPSPRR